MPSEVGEKVMEADEGGGGWTKANDGRMNSEETQKLGGGGGGGVCVGGGNNKATCRGKASSSVRDVPILYPGKQDWGRR